MSNDSERTIVDRLLDPDDPITPQEAAAEIRKLWDETTTLRLKLSSEKAFYRALEMQCENAWKQVAKLRRQLCALGAKEEPDRE